MNPIKKAVAALRRYRRLRRFDAAFARGAGAVEPELRILHRYLKQDQAFFDIGANDGSYMYVAQKHIPAECIYGFEPQESYVQELRSQFPRAHVMRCALSSRAGEVRLKIPIVKGSLYRTRGTLENYKEPGEEGARYETVPMMTLDMAAATLGDPFVACMKIDVEGHERYVLEGACGTIARCKPALFIEIEQRHHAEPIAGIFRFVESLGYDGYFLNAAQELAPLSAFDAKVRQRAGSFKTADYVNNFIFLPHGKN